MHFAASAFSFISDIFRDLTLPLCICVIWLSVNHYKSLMHLNKCYIFLCNQYSTNIKSQITFVVFVLLLAVVVVVHIFPQ